MVVIIGVCVAMFAIGGTLLFFAFRAYGTSRRGDIKHVVLMAAAIAFILFCCAGLLVWSSMQPR